MEEQEILDPLNEVHLFCLHVAFIDEINKSLSEFINQWNHHALSTENNNFPLQLWIAGILQSANNGQPILDEIIDQEDIFWYGAEGVINQLNIRDDVQVEVPRMNLPLADYDVDYIRALVPYETPKEERIEKYILIVQIQDILNRN